VQTLRLCFIVTFGCNVSIEKPPIEVAHRDSLIGAGKIIQVKNTSNETLEKIEIRISSPSGEERTYTEETLGAYETFELGWKRLGGWEIQSGFEVSVRCKGYVRGVSSEIPDE
jgi:hypothetical protein